jgi:hypothetical protein
LVDATGPEPDQRQCVNIHAARAAVKHDLGREGADGMHKSRARTCLSEREVRAVLAKAGK